MLGENKTNIRIYPYFHPITHIHLNYNVKFKKKEILKEVENVLVIFLFDITVEKVFLNMNEKEPNNEN